MQTLNVSTEPHGGTPSLKRKRKCGNTDEITTTKEVASAAGITNAAFSSTPKKLNIRRRLSNKNSKENSANFANSGFEVKSIADIANQRNPYEVVRPHKKKKLQSSEELGCFANEALNLELPEKQFNPFEVVREKEENKSVACFINPALNLKVQDAPALKNPFEIERKDSAAEKEKNASSLEGPRLQIGIPFVPTVGSRIDFRNVSMSQLTPSKLLAEKLVFSPVPPKPKTSVGGEETTMDICKELDRYQLELENSINEAKQRKTGVFDLAEDNAAQVISIDHKIAFTEKLTQIQEVNEENITIQEQSTTTVEIKENFNTQQITQEKEIFEKIPAIVETNPFAASLADDENINDFNELYGPAEDDIEENDDSFDFVTPAAFVRTYRGAELPKVCLNEKPESDEQHVKKSKGVQNIIRNSIRKLMHSNHQDKGQQEQIQLEEKEKQLGFISTIRQSLRRKPQKTLLIEEPEIKDLEISIIDTGERNIKLKSNLTQNDYYCNDRKNGLRHSIRKSTREVGHQLLKNVFNKKHEEYDFKK